MPNRHKPICGNAPRLISTANVIIPQSPNAQAEMMLFNRGVAKLFLCNMRSAWDPTYLHIGCRLHSLRGEVLCCIRLDISHKYVKEQSGQKQPAWQGCTSFDLEMWLHHQSAAAAYAFMNPLSLSLFNRNVSYLTPRKAKWLLECSPRQVAFTSHDLSQVTCTPWVYTSSIDTVKGKPLTIAIQITQDEWVKIIEARWTIARNSRSHVSCFRSAVVHFRAWKLTAVRFEKQWY